MSERSLWVVMVDEVYFPSGWDLTWIMYFICPD
jgi:hypothetical protein